MALTPVLGADVFHDSTGSRCMGSGRRVETIARELGLPELADASSSDERWWGNEATIVAVPVDCRYLAGDHDRPEVTTVAWTEDEAMLVRPLAMGLSTR